MRTVLEYALAIFLAGVCINALAAPAHRIVSLSPSLTELTYAAGAGRYLVGAAATDYSHYPPEAANLPSVGDAFQIDIERLVALKPDVVFAWASSNPPKLLARLRGLGFEVEVFEPRKLGDIAANLRRIGKIAGTTKAAEKAAGAFERKLKRLRARYSDREPVTVFYEISAHPLYTVNGEQIISEGIKLCGGRNIFADLSSLAAPVGVANVIGRDPRAIVTDDSGTPEERLDAWRQWPRLAAVKQDALFIVPANLISQATPRMLKGIRMICRDLSKVRERASGDSSER